MPSFDTQKKDHRDVALDAFSHIDDIRTARALAEMIAGTVREGMLVLDLDFRVVAANASFCQLFEVEPEATVGRVVYDLGNGQWDIPEIRTLLEDLVPHHAVVEDYEVDHTFEGLGRRQMLLNARRLDEHALMLLTIQSVTERRQSERDLHQSEEQYRTLFESIDQGFCIVEVILDEEGQGLDYRFLEANPAFERHTGLVDAVGKTARELVPDLEEHWPETYGRIATTGEPEQFVMGSEAMARWFEVDAFRVGAPEERRVALLFTDVTERMKAEETVRALNASLEARVEERTRQVRDLSRRLTMAEQEERRRISQILHDDLQQLLYGVEMKLSLLHQDLEQQRQADLLADVDDARAWVELAALMTQKLTVDLSPPILQEEGLADALKWLQRQMHELHNLEVTVEAEHAFYIEDEDLRVLLFQIVRELLFNVRKHAATSRATVRLDVTPDRIAIYVSDEGQGFDVEKVAAHEATLGGFGLFSARERLRLLGGRLEVRSEPGVGTEVEIHAPTPRTPGRYPPR